MKLIVDHTWTYIEDDYPDYIIEKVTRYLVPGSWFSPSFRKGQWDGTKNLLVKRGKRHKFPTGLLEMVTAELDKHERHYTLEDNREFPLLGAPAYELAGVKLRDYQREALDEALARNRGTLVMATGAGKSLLGASIIKSLGLPAVWVTHREALLHQTRENLEHYLGEPIGIAGDGKLEVQRVTVAMVQTLDNSDNAKYDRLRDYLKSEVGLMIADEVHHLGSVSDSWYENLNKIGAPYRFGLTATPDFSGHGLKLLAQTGPEIYRIGTQDLIRKGFLVPPRIWLVEINNVDKPKARAKSPEVMKQAVVYNTERTAHTVEVAREFAEEKKPTLILVRFLNHLELINDALGRAGLRTDVIHGRVGKPQRELVLSALKQGLLDCVVAQVEIMGEGVDLPWLRAVVNATGSSGGGDAGAGKDGDTGRKTIQILGRALRPYAGKSYCDVVDFVDYNHKILKNASDSRLGTYIAEGHGPNIHLWSEYDALKSQLPV